MNDLIQINTRQVGDESIQTVNARDLHAFLEVGSRYNDWIKNRIDQYKFEAGRDFETVTETLVGGGLAKTHHLSIDMAKELSMVERNEKGKQARLYFIECERRAKAAPAIDLNDPAFLRSTLLTYTEKVLALESVVAEKDAALEKQAPKIEVFDRLIEHTEGAMPIRRAAAVLQYPERKLTELLDSRHWIYKLPDRQEWFVHAEVRRRGYMETKLHSGLKESGEQWTRSQPLITTRGLARIAYYLNQAGAH